MDYSGAHGDAATKAIGVQVKRLREAAGLTQGALARALQERGLTSVRQPALARIETGDRRLQFGEALALADILGVSLDEMRPDSVRETYEIRRLAFRVAESREDVTHALAEHHLVTEDLAEALNSAAAESLDPPSLRRASRLVEGYAIEDVATSAKRLAENLRDSRRTMASFITTDAEST